MMLLVLLCTLAQVQWGTYGAVERTIRSFLVYWQPPGRQIHIPVFPGGGLLGVLLLLNLAAAQAGRLELSARKAGMWAVHLGLALLFAGEFVTGFLQVDSRMMIEEGQTRDYTEASREAELAVIDASNPRQDTVYSIPQALLERAPRRLEHPGLPFSLLVKGFYRNASLERREPGREGPPSVATQGLGPRLIVFARPAAARDDEADSPAAFLEIIDGDRGLGTWLVSSSLGAEQSFSYLDRTWRLALRPKRRYLPFSLTLKDFRHEKHPGTEVPRHFSSLVRLEDPARGEARDALISMNSPLRHEGRTFYQASFGRDDTLSILQVVENPGWLLPYLACLLVGGGLLAHFLQRLSAARRRPA